MRQLKENKPTADVLMFSMRAMGYSFESAVADIIDNSISACASNVQIRFPVDPADCYVVTCDNGNGMSRQELFDAMKYGSEQKREGRSETDLGRFGLGLKAASLSQCRKLTVASKKDGQISAYMWDLDIIEEKHDWYVVECSDEEIRQIRFIEWLDNLSSGTVVVWEDFDFIEKSSGSVYAELNKLQESTSEYLSLIFHRYLNKPAQNRLTIKVNNYQLVGYDPFLENHNKTNVRRKISIPIKDSQGIERMVTVQPFILPFQKDLSAEDKKLSGGIENYRSKQGFYVYRNKRLLVWGTWFRMHRKDELSKLARIRVDIPNSLDHLWTLDIRKSTAVPPDVIKRNLERVVERISEGSKRAWTFRGKREISDQGCHLWNKEKAREGVQYVLNRDHVFLKTLSESLTTEQKHILFSYLKLVEGNLPLNQLYVDLNNEERVNVRKEKDAETEAMDFARIILENIKDSSSRKEQIQLMLQTDPFCNYKSVIEMLTKELES